MSDAEYGKEQQDEDLRVMAEAVDQIGTVLLLEQDIKADVDRKVKAIVDEGVTRTKPVLDERDRLMAIIAPAYLRLLEAKVIKGKTISLPSGTVSTRLATSTEVHKVAELMKFMRRLGKLTKMSKRPTRTVDKSALAELLDSDPQLAAKIEGAGLAERVVNTRLTVKPTRAKLKFERDISPADRVVVVAPSPAP